jgi:hypothetical protein
MFFEVEMLRIWQYLPESIPQRAQRVHANNRNYHRHLTLLHCLGNSQMRLPNQKPGTLQQSRH